MHGLLKVLYKYHQFILIMALALVWDHVPIAKVIRSGVESGFEVLLKSIELLENVGTESIWDLIRSGEPINNPLISDIFIIRMTIFIKHRNFAPRELMRFGGTIIVFRNDSIALQFVNASGVEETFHIWDTTYSLRWDARDAVNEYDVANEVRMMLRPAIKNIYHSSFYVSLRMSINIEHQFKAAISTTMMDVYVDVTNGHIGTDGVEIFAVFTSNDIVWSDTLSFDADITQDDFHERLEDVFNQVKSKANILKSLILEPVVEEAVYINAPDMRHISERGVLSTILEFL